MTPLLIFFLPFSKRYMDILLRKATPFSHYRLPFHEEQLLKEIIRKLFLTVTPAAREGFFVHVYESRGKPFENKVDIVYSKFTRQPSRLVKNP